MLLEELVLPLRTDNVAFKAGLAAAAAGVAALVAGMGLAIKATFKWADELDSIQDIMGGTNKTAAALNFTLRKSGTATESLTKGMTILSKGLVKADGSLDVTGKSLKAWGINVLDANGMLKDQTTLIGDISDKYGTFATQQEKVNFLTETFGRSGADLIDFFDTLAAEGGIDTVAEKVERLGLAIDPNRYEQFNRNLEELKLIGLSLAVGFTEKVMPVIEKFLGLISDPKGIDTGKILAWADNTIGTFLKGLGDEVNNWINEGGPEKLTDDIVSWIENLGEGETFASKALIGAEHLVTAIAKAIGKVDWQEITDTMDTKIAEGINSQDWQAAGDSFGEKVEAFIENAMAGDRIPKTLGESNTGEAVKNAVASWFEGALGPENMKAFETFGIFLTGWTQRTFGENWRSAGSTAALALVTGWNTGVSAFITALQALAIQIYNKLTDIAKEFYNRAQGWVNQAIQGFQANKGRLLAEIGAIVTAINTILKKIITSFILTFGINAGGLGGAGGSSNLGSGSSGNPAGSVVTPGQIGGRASGGPVIGGQLYGFNVDKEWFVPNENGRVEKKQQQTINVNIDEGRLARTIVQALMAAQGG